MKNRFLIVADDFTGANDTGVQLRRRGLETEVLFAGTEPSEAFHGAVVIDTESRTTDPVHAYEIVAQAAAGIDFSAYAYVIKKVDSTLRGNIAEELRAIDEAMHPELILFAPALPDLGRTTKDGVHLLKGKRICETELARDPKNPVKEDRLSELLKSVYEEPVQTLKLDAVRDGKLSFAETKARLFACDAETNDDLFRLVSAARASGKRVLYVGTAGLVDNIMRAEYPVKPALAIVASLSSVTGAQVRYCEREGMKLVKLPVDEVLLDETVADRCAEEAIESLRAGRDTIFVTNTSYDRSELEASQEAGRRLGKSLAETGDLLRSLMGRLSRRILEQTEVSGMFVTGGDTALGVMMHLGAEGSTILAELLVGIPLIAVKGGPFDGLRLVTKAGAFGGEDALAFAMRKLKEG